MIFFRNQNAIDQFDACFPQTEDGQILFQPPKSEFGLPISWEEYQAVMAAFERVHVQNMVIMWIVTLGAGAYGLYAVIAENSYATFFMAWGASLVFSICLHARDGLRVLLPLIERREELQKAMMAETTQEAKFPTSPAKPH